MRIPKYRLKALCSPGTKQGVLAARHRRLKDEERGPATEFALSAEEAQRPRNKGFALEIHFVGLPGQVSDADFLDENVSFPYKVQT